jgi:two-component system CheB/CheR fusion protein
MKLTPTVSSTVSSKDKVSDSIRGQFQIVCLGASAGGLEAIEQFLGSVPQKSGMAYVVIQHLDPTQKGMLPELLQRISKMEVLQVKDQMAVKPNFVYVIPPNKSMSILKGVFHLFELVETRGLRLPIDFFLSALAEDQQERSVGVILSGMGSDGSKGILAIKEKKGIVMAQEPTTAKFDSMPRNAIDSGLVDIVAPANELYAKLVNFNKHIPEIKPDLKPEIQDKSALQKIVFLLRTQTGSDFSLYKKNTVYRRIERRMSIHKIDKIASYVRFLQDNPHEVDLLFKELLIGVTNFFRDVVVWERLKASVIPSVIAQTKAGSVLRSWVIGCSTGEEAYSLAIVFKEALGMINAHGSISLQIFATDLDNEAIEIARKGHFPATITSDVSPERLKRFFIKTEDGYRINSEIRDMVVFAKHNIIMHAPFTKIDILTCRNLLIYMDSDLQKKILGLFYYSLNPGGIMVLGSAETPGAQNHLFSQVDAKLKIYKHSGSPQVHELIDFPSSFSRITPATLEKQMPDKSFENIETLTDQLLLQHFSPPGVLVNENGDIIYISGHTGKYLEPAVGKANLNIFAMLREGLRNDFPLGFHKAIHSKETVVLSGLKVGISGMTQTVNVTIQWIGKPEPLNGMIMIIFTDVKEVFDAKILAKPGGKNLRNVRISELEAKLQQKRDEMQSTLEMMQTSQEEQKSTNEELQSTNEEFQSTNEELTTSKEEMQSLNEELQTVNAELQSKIDDFFRVDNDMKNLLNSTDIATLFLDKKLNIRRYTDSATKIFKLIKSDIGRPFTDLVTDLSYPKLADDALEVLRTLVFIQKQISAKDNRWFSVRIMPYRTFDDRIDGLVITFVNNSDHHQLEEELHETEQMHRFLLNSSSDVIIRLSARWKILEFNPEAEKLFGKKRHDAINQDFIQLFIPEATRKKTENELNKLLNEAFNGKYKMQVITSGGDTPEVLWSVNVLLNDLKIATGMIISTKRKD